MSGDTCLCPASGAKPKLGSFKGGGLGNKYVQLNVGGSLYYTTVRALTRHDTMLKAMFSGRMEVLTDKEGLLHLESSVELRDSWKSDVEWCVLTRFPGRRSILLNYSQRTRFSQE
ncbi:btb poz domain-containing adapter for, partial [Lynx pardinus]